MPVAKIIEIPYGKLGVWNLTESAEKLAGIFQFSTKEETDFHNIKNETRKREFLAVRLLLEKLLGQKSEISYNEHRKPQIKNKNLYISISHCSGLVVVLISNYKVGIDVENIYRNTEKIAPRFLSEQEKHEIENTPELSLTRIIYWCAKETAFKIAEHPEIEFKTHIQISPFKVNPAGGSFRGKLCKNEPASQLAFQYFFFGNNVVVYCVEQVNLEK
jgi:4'-phosphopantetheinyl transferase EntD